MRQQRWEEGLRHLEPASTTRKISADLLRESLCRRCRARTRTLDDARRSYERALTLFPVSQASRLGLAAALGAAGDREARYRGGADADENPEGRADDDPWWIYYDSNWGSRRRARSDACAVQEPLDDSPASMRWPCSLDQARDAADLFVARRRRSRRRARHRFVAPAVARTDPADFSIRDNGMPQTLTSSASARLSLNVGLAFDLSEQRGRRALRAIASRPAAR